MFGWEYVRYTLRVSWCHQDGTITSSRYQRYANVWTTIWEFAGHIDQSISGGEGRDCYEVFTQGHFRFCVRQICLQRDYPWVRIVGNGDGSGNLKRGG